MGPSNSDAEPTVRGFSSGVRVFGRYTLETILGHGGMGVVWRARDEVLGEDVALKFLPDAVRWDPGAYDDLKAETRRARQLTHPNIVRIHDFVEDAGSAAISMELVAGATLTALRVAKDNKVFEPADIIGWLPQLCAALDYAHAEARVVHRDLKPTNLMLTPDGRLKVADFGVARSMADSLTRVSMMSAGTLVYMSPQQAMGEEPSPADDVYAIGATLYELLTGKPPFHTGDVRLQLFQRQPDSLGARRRVLGVEGGDMPEAWEQTVAACLAKEPAARPRTAGEVVRRLSEPAPGPVAARRTRSAPPRSWVRQWSLPGALAVTVAFAAWNYWPRASATPAAASFPSDATRALAAWNFDGDGRDGSGRGFDGTVGNAVPTTDRHGRIDRALRFNGSASVTVSDTPELRWGGAQPFTSTVWVRRAASVETSESCWRSSGSEVGTLAWWIGFDNGRPSLGFGPIHADAYGQIIALTASRASRPDEWQHVAVVHDGGSITLYVDGKHEGSSRLGSTRTALPPKRVEMRFGRPERVSSGGFAGDIDEARVWRRPLSAGEIAALARREPPPRFVLSSGTPFDTDDLAAAMDLEFGPEARLADWEVIKRHHADDTRAWADELGFGVGATLGWVQRSGQPTADGKRHYFLNRFDGTKPAYYEAHDELGGMTLALGSWRGFRCALLATLPAVEPRRRKLTADAAGVLRIDHDSLGPVSALALVWKRLLVPAETRGLAVEIRLRDDQRLGALCRPAGTGALAIALTDSARPERSRQVATTMVELEFTLTVRDGALRFRAVSVVGGNLVFDERSAPTGLKLAEIASLELSGLPRSGEAGAQRGLASATLIVE